MPLEFTSTLHLSDSYK